MLGKIGGGRIEDAADPAIEREFAAADGVDGDAGRVGRIFDRKFHVDLHWDVAKEAAFEADEGNFVVELPWNVIARADVNVFVGQTLVHDRLDRFSLGSFLRGQPGPAEHVEEIGIAAGVELIGALDFHAPLPEKIDNRAVEHGRAQLRFDIVADDRQIFVGEPLCPNRITGDEDGDVVYKSDSGFERAAGVKPRGLIGADRQIIDHDLGGGIFQLGNDLFAGGFLFQRQKSAERIVVGHVRGEAVEDAAHFHDRAGEIDLIAKVLGAIGRRKNGFADVEPDFAAIDIEGGDDLNVSRAIGTDLLVRQADGGAV